jgi:4-amino-4-deoxy-L-arabinose transferase-like glycosyltransferase
MLLNYLGTLKSWLYRPMIRAFGTGVWATRLPMLLAGAASIWLFYWFLRRVAGDRAAVIGSGLLAVDSVYLLSSCLDWGPVALQHLLLIGGLLLLMKFWQQLSEPALAGGFFLFGLALWDKALASWILIGMGTAAMLVLPREILSVFRARRLVVALLALLVGALPLIIYNLNTGGGTLHGTVAAENGSLTQKVKMLWLTANGTGLYRFVPFEDFETAHPHEPRTALERISAAVGWATGYPRTNLLLAAFCLSLLFLYMIRGPERRAILFALLAMAIAWGQMFFTAGAGSSVHHTILLWPLPQMVIGIAFAAASRRLGSRSVPVTAAALVVMMAWGLAVTNAYYSRIVRNGGSREWSDAIFPLSNYLSKTPAYEIFAADWGIMDSLRLLNRGRLSLGLVGITGDDAPVPLAEQSRLTKLISRPDDLFVTHAAEYVFFLGADAKLARYASERGFRKEMVATIADSYERPTFEIYRFVRAVPH